MAAKLQKNSDMEEKNHHPQRNKRTTKNRAYNTPSR